MRHFVLSTFVLVSLFGSAVTFGINGLEYRTVEWEQLLPQEDLDAFLNPPDYIWDIEEGAMGDQVVSALKSDLADPQDAYQRALVSTKIVGDMDNQAIRIPGFVVPLEFDEKRRVTSFFLVPFFGACIHVPPPPPNQIIFMESPEGMELDNIYDPLWISGVLRTTLTENAMATSAYSMVVHLAEPYVPEPFGG